MEEFEGQEKPMEFEVPINGFAAETILLAATSKSAFSVIKAGDFILKPTKLHMERNLLPIFRNKVKLVFSELDEADAAILGASALVWEK